MKTFPVDVTKHLQFRVALACSREATRCYCHFVVDQIGIYGGYNNCHSHKTIEIVNQLTADGEHSGF